ncbi:MAG: hypothetical protein ABUL47_02060, partial [Leifsonia sp.]
AGAGVVVLLAIAAAMATFQLRLYGSPVTPTASGGSSVDAFAVATPALLIITIVLVGLLAFPRLAPLYERAAARRDGADGVLAARSVARRISLGATPIALVALGVAQLVIASGYSGSWQRSFDQTQALRDGTELSVSVPDPGLDEHGLDKLTRAQGVDRVIPVVDDDIKLGDDYVSLVGVSAAALSELGLDGGGTVDIAGLARHIRVDPAGVELPAGRTLTVRLAMRTIAGGPDVAVWFEDDDGLLRRSAATPSPDPAHHDYVVTIPKGPGHDHRWRLAGIDVTPPQGHTLVVS